MRYYRFAFLFALISTGLLLAVDQEPLSIATTHHIKEMLYNRNGVHKYTGFFGYPSSIVFEDGEVIESVVSGNQSWDIQTKDNRLFLKPIEDNAETNVIILTNKRRYLFQFYGKEADSMHDPRLAYEVRFKYPSDNIEFNNVDDKTPHSEGLDLLDKPILNFNYKVSGSDIIKPLKVLDDGEFTYFQFRDANAELPAIFLVDSEGYEAVVNYHISGSYLVVERVAARFTLRHGADHVCVFNENMKYKKKRVKRAGLFQ